MKDQILGPYGEILELRSALEAEVGHEVGLGDPLLLRRFFLELLENPANRSTLHHQLLSDPLAPGFPLDDQALSTYLAQQIERGVLRLVRPGDGAARELPQIHTGGGSEEPTETEPVEQEVKVKDWKLECAHHVTNGRDVIEKGTRIELVPDVGKTKDKVKVHWRDDWQPSMPGSLDVNIPGHPAGSAAQAGSSGPYTTYEYEAEYLGDIDIFNVINPGFWRAYKETTTHTIRPGPASIPVKVYNPRQFKFEFKLPAMKSFKAGVEYEADSVKALAKPKEVRERLRTDDAYWGSGTMAVDQYKTPPPGTPPKPLVDTISLARDGSPVKVEVLRLVGEVLEFADLVRSIVKMVTDYAPKVGWYIDFDLQLMQGGVAVEWYWKEHTDHRVFQYIDFGINLTIFAITFEIGIGVSACSFKLQIYAQLKGELAVECGIKRDDPDGAPGFRLPGVKGKITGALGARAEAGHVFQFNAKGETAIEAEVQIGVNQRSSMITADARTRWTGIECTCTYSAGMLGISYNKTSKWILVPPGPWWGLTWPKDEPYQPPTMSKSAIANSITNVLTRGWDLLVYSDDKSSRYSHRAVANFVAEHVERDSAFDKTPKVVDALANSVRKDLDKLSDRGHWSRDWVALSDLRRYCGGSVFKAHLAAAASPTRKMIADNS